VTEKTGLLDGRSNADMAFEQKCCLLEEYRQMAGHLNVKLTDGPRYLPLVSFIVKQRKYYRAYRNGQLKSSVNVDRIHRLESLGFEWSRRPDHEAEFVKWYDRLVIFQRQYGHCCVNAVPETATNDPELVKFVARQRKYYKDFSERERRQKSSQNDAHVGDDSGSDSILSGDEEDDDEEEEAEPVPEPIDGDATTAADATARPPKKPKRIVLPKFYTSSMRERIEALNDPFLTVDPNEIAVAAASFVRYCKTVKFLRPTKSYHPNSISWYQRFEEFRAFYQSHGHGFVPLSWHNNSHANTNNKRDGLKQFVRLERALHDAMTNSQIAVHPVFMRNVEFLKSHGFVYDETAIQAEQARLQALEVKQRREELYRATPRGQLEVMEQNARVVKEQLEAAQDRKRAAEEAWNVVHRDYLKVRKKIRAAEEKAAHDPVGSIVYVRDRGPGKPGGRAKVTRYSVTKVLNEMVKFYDVVYLDDNDNDGDGEERVDTFIEGRFVDDGAKAVAADRTKDSDEDYGDDDNATMKQTPGIMTRNKRKAITQSKTTSTNTTVSPTMTTKTAGDAAGKSLGQRAKKKRKTSGGPRQQQQEPPPHLQVIDNMIPDQQQQQGMGATTAKPKSGSAAAAAPHQQRAASGSPPPQTTKPSTGSGPPAVTQPEKAAAKPHDGKPSSKTGQTISSSSLAKPASPLLPGSRQTNVAPIVAGAKPGQANGIASPLKLPHAHSPVNNNISIQPTGMSGRTLPKHPLQAPVPTSIPIVKPKTSEPAPVVKPKHPVGSLVNVRWRGEQKPGGIGKVVNFFTTKVLSEILPFYEVEYVVDGQKTRDANIEGRFIEEC
jgi:hypothetical protein